ncbi:ATP-dependent nuclease [Photobacterium leiognathi]|uniref:ATP-dependent nuclease n=1 Tax=Photobacterium leiognathi TaxID=553611 RepID=UPI002982243F|nr:AAA family ATPase [Photobacterium leiognathi]
MIRLISIKNFRSIQAQVAPIEEITTFVGQNDAGKSNILRALNLFFNAETDLNTSFNFKSDFNVNAKTYKQRAKEVVIELGLKLPKTYRREGFPDTVYWKKVWRSSGEHKEGEEIKYCEIKNNRFTKKQNFPARSKIKSLLENINFIYVPAIKDKTFFVELQGKIYDVLAQTAESELHKSANSFELKIKKEFTELLRAIDGTFNNSNSISLPQNLRGIFENLEFNADNIPLSRRGDGIKIRHIPSMLRFIGDKSGNRHKTLITPQIWGFEEPENNVEFSSCFALNNEFIEAAKNNIQVILTTHSPAIYNIGHGIENNSNLKAARFHVGKCEQTGATELSVIEDENLHQRIGFMPLIAPMIAEQKRKWYEEKSRQDDIIASLEKELALEKKHRLFVEGKSDKAVFSKVIEVYFPELLEHVHFDLKGNNCANSATDKAKAFHLIQKHNKDEYKLKGALILDNDSAGIKCKDLIDAFLKESNSSNIKVTLIPKPPQVFNLLKKGFSVVADLESCLPEDIWRHALNNGWLEEKTPLAKKFTKEKMVEIFNSDINAYDFISEQSEFEQMLINYSFTTQGKANLSKYISSMDVETLKEKGTLANFEPLFHKVSEFIMR